MPRSRSTASPSQQEEAILKAAAEEVALVGFARASMDVVARQAGVSRSTLYRRFPSRDLLIAELGRRSFEAAMTRLRTVGIDDGPKGVAVAAFREGLRLMSSDPVIQRFLQPDAEVLSVSGVYSQAAVFLDSASTAMAKGLRASGATMPDADLQAVAQLHIRLACSLAQVPTAALDVRDDAAVRAYAERFLAPLVW